MNECPLKPSVGWVVLVECGAEEVQSTAGIILTASARQEQIAKVAAIAERVGDWDEGGVECEDATTYAVGQEVVWKKGSETRVVRGGKDYLLVREDHILATVK